MEYVDGEDLGVAAPPDWKAAGAEGVGDRASTVRGPRCGAREALAATATEAGQRDDRRPRPRAPSWTSASRWKRGWRPRRASSRAPLPYMAPERFRGRAGTVQSDIYALGLILYEAFTGRSPFQASTVEEWDTVAQVVRAGQTLAASPPRSIRPPNGSSCNVSARTPPHGRRRRGRLPRHCPEATRSRRLWRQARRRRRNWWRPREPKGRCRGARRGHC